MNSIRLWQSTFLIGVAALLLASALAFGISSVMTIVGFAAIAIGVINGFLSKPINHFHRPAATFLYRSLRGALLLQLAVYFQETFAPML
jgi:hypothetical protein